MEDSACMSSHLYLPSTCFHLLGVWIKESKGTPVRRTAYESGVLHHFHHYLPEILRAWSQDKKWWKIDWKSESFCSWETLLIIQPYQPWLPGLANFEGIKPSWLFLPWTLTLPPASPQGHSKGTSTLSHCFSWKQTLNKEARGTTGTVGSC